MIKVDIFDDGSIIPGDNTVADRENAQSGKAVAEAMAIEQKSANNKIQNDIKTNQAATDERISELTRKVRMHNDFARRIPIIEEQIRAVNHRVADLEELYIPNN